jgi:hypothetical protein
MHVQKSSNITVSEMMERLIACYTTKEIGYLIDLPSEKVKAIYENRELLDNNLINKIVTLHAVINSELTEP